MCAEFKWTEDLIKEFAEQYRFSSSRITIEQFKESKQLGWEALELINNNGAKSVYEGTNESVYPTRHSWAYNFLRERIGWSVYKVRRFSDGEVFTVGDKYQNDSKIMVYTIKDFEIRNGILLANAVEHGFDFFEDLIKIKEVLFTTHDGINIHKGMEYWYVTDAWQIGNNVAHTGSGTNSFQYFSNKEKAEEYVLMNKPLLSINDTIIKLNEILNVNNSLDVFGRKFIEKAKEKLKQ